MPYMTVVTLADEDGDEFPIGILGRPEDDAEAERLAMERVAALKSEEPRFRPRGVLRFVSAEYPPEVA
jgi:hypothetical protein